MGLDLFAVRVTGTKTIAGQSIAPADQFLLLDKPGLPPAVAYEGDGYPKGMFVRPEPGAKRVLFVSKAPLFDSAGYLHTWRNRFDLYDYLNDLYLARGGRQGCLNMFVTVRLTEADLDDFEDIVMNTQFSDPDACSLGKKDCSCRKSDLQFLQKARDTFANGDSVLVFAWE